MESLIRSFARYAYGPQEEFIAQARELGIDVVKEVDVSRINRVGSPPAIHLGICMRLSKSWGWGEDVRIPADVWLATDRNGVSFVCFDYS